jgi:hypothetical protein
MMNPRATTRSQPDPQIVQALQVSKHTILSIVKAPKGLGVPRGVMAVAWKFVQRILLIGTRNGGADPRVSPALSVQAAPPSVEKNSPLPSCTSVANNPAPKQVGPQRQPMACL